MHIAYALANVESYSKEYMNAEEKENIFDFLSKFRPVFGKEVSDGVTKMSYIFNGLLRNQSNLLFQPTIRTVKYEIDRTIEIIKQIDDRVCKWKKGAFLDSVMVQIKYGVPAHLRSLVGIPNIGKARAEKLYNAGFTNIEQVKTNIERASKIAGCKIVL